PSFPPTKILEASVIKADELMRLPRAELQRRCRDKGVVVANGRHGFPGESAPTPDGRLLPRRFGPALAIEAMLQRGSTIRSAGPNAEYASTFIAEALGVAFVFLFPGRERLVGVCALGTCIAAIGASLLVLRLGGAMFNPI